MKRLHLLSSITEKSLITIEKTVCLKYFKKRNWYLMKSKVKVRCYGNTNSYKCHVMVMCTVPKVLCSLKFPMEITSSFIMACGCGD